MNTSVTLWPQDVREDASLENPAIDTIRMVAIRFGFGGHVELPQ
jgi:hypothetical protein